MLAPPWRRALDCTRGLGSQTFREMAEGFSRFKPGCTVQIKDDLLRIVSVSELMGVTSEAPLQTLKT